MSENEELNQKLSAKDKLYDRTIEECEGFKSDLTSTINDLNLKLKEFESNAENLKNKLEESEYESENMKSEIQEKES